MDKGERKKYVPSPQRKIKSYTRVHKIAAGLVLALLSLGVEPLPCRLILKDKIKENLLRYYRVGERSTTNEALEWEIFLVAVNFVFLVVFVSTIIVFPGASFSLQLPTEFVIRSIVKKLTTVCKENKYGMFLF